MSAAAAPVAPTGWARRVAARAVPDADRAAHPVLRLVPDVRTGAPKAPFITLVVLLLAGGLLGLLAVNTVLAQDAFRLHALSVEGKALADREQVLEREVETLRTPRNLAARARELGMVQSSSPAFLRLEDGRVLGAEVPAEAPPPVEGPPAP
jgi:cell division protein FtsB